MRWMKLEPIIQSEVSQKEKHQYRKATAPHSSTLAWKIPWTEEPGRLQSMGSQRVKTELLDFHFSLSCIGEGNGNPLQCSCLENPRDGGAWWAVSMGSHRVGHDWSKLAAAAAAQHKNSLGCLWLLFYTFYVPFISTFFCSITKNNFKNSTKKSYPISLIPPQPPRSA